jgi:chaperonin GroEL (HSP60 family)
MTVTDATQQTSQSALSMNIEHAQVVANTVRSTLGPKGLDKMLTDAGGRVTITNDGATILRNVNWVSPIAKKIVEVARTQEEQCYDGTTTAIILTAELLKKAELLLESGVHPTTIVEGYRTAALKSKEFLTEMVIDPDEEMLLAIAKTAMTGKSAEGERDLLAKLCLEVVEASRPEAVHIMTRTGSPISESFSPNGIVIGRQKFHSAMPTELTHVKVALLDGGLELEAFGQGVNLNLGSYSESLEYQKGRKEALKSMADHFINLGANLVLVTKNIDPWIAEYFARQGVLAARRCAASNLEAVAQATDGLIVSGYEDLEESDLGTAGRLEEILQEGQPPFMLLHDTPNNDASSLVICAPTEEVANEIRRAMDDAMGVVWVAKNEGKIVPGGSAPQVEMANRLRTYAASVGGRESLAVEAFADSLEVVPRTLAENAGLSPIDTLMELRKAHSNSDGKTSSMSYGLNVYTGEVVDMLKEGVIEPEKVVRQAMESATETAVMVLRIDDIISAKEPEIEDLV